jgi:hypothetical protein
MVRFNSGFYQKRFGGNNKITSASINLGCTKGRGSIIRTLRSNSRNAHLYTRRNNNYGFNIGSYTRRNYR